MSATSPATSSISPGSPGSSVNPADLMACHDCDLLHHRRSLPRGGKALCRRCGAVLYRHRANAIERSLSLQLTAAVLLVLTCGFPFMGFALSGQVNETHLFSGIQQLYQQGYWPLASLVLLTIVLVPGLQISGSIYVLWPLHHGRRAPAAARVFRWVRAMRPWAMIEVYVLGVLVSLVKLAGYATILPGVALFSLGALMLTLAAAAATLDPDQVWQKLGAPT